MIFKHLTLRELAFLPWYVFVIVWLLAATRVKSTKAIESVGSRLSYAIPMAAGCYLLFAHGVHMGPLNARFVPAERWIQVAGVVITWAGTAFAIWARVVIGANWSARITRKVGHDLVKSGPYAYVRHPIYSGLTLALLGTALVIGEWRALVGVLLAIAGECLKAQREEKFMLEEFGAGYEEYRRQAGFLLPRF